MPSNHVNLLPHIVHSTGTWCVKNEDIVYVNAYQDASLAIFVVCDGHAGPDAANYVVSHFNRILSANFPTTLPSFSNEHDVNEYAERVRLCVTQTFAKVDNEWAAMAQDAGTTVTVAIVTGWLLTVANAGDSLAFLDTPTGHSDGPLELCQSHRISVNEGERQRLTAAGVQLAPLGFHLQGPAQPNEVGVGPLRLWPGGLCVSRSVGDLDAGPEVAPVPHVKQLLLPPSGCRLVMATDGLWDVMKPQHVLDVIRPKTHALAVSTLINKASRDRRNADDISIVVVDILPSDKATYPSLLSPASLERKKPSGGCLSCFGAAPLLDVAAAPSGPRLELLSDVDCLLQYPMLQRMLTRSSVRLKTGPSTRLDYTMHGPADARVFKGADVAAVEVSVDK